MHCVPVPTEPFRGVRRALQYPTPITTTGGGHEGGGANGEYTWYMPISEQHPDDQLLRDEWFAEYLARNIDERGVYATPSCCDGIGPLNPRQLCSKCRPASPGFFTYTHLGDDWWPLPAPTAPVQTNDDTPLQSNPVKTSPIHAKVCTVGTHSKPIVLDSSDDETTHHIKISVEPAKPTASQKAAKSGLWAKPKKTKNRLEAPVGFQMSTETTERMACNTERLRMGLHAITPFVTKDEKTPASFQHAVSTARVAQFKADTECMRKITDVVLYPHHINPGARKELARLTKEPEEVFSKHPRTLLVAIDSLTRVEAIELEKCNTERARLSLPSLAKIVPKDSSVPNTDYLTYLSRRVTDLKMEVCELALIRSFIF